ncbi:Lrp/AsnC ligand binding domain-containing protein [Halolamina sp.]|uniref:Lrp/AsnC family transcriptional regulator n=1 Tax=Halolamina sp. TaxID=1940283 RepID=UPI0006777D8C
MVTAYVMIKANTANVKQLSDAIHGVDAVESCHIVAGDVDLIAKLTADNPDGILEVVGEELRGLEGVEETQTYLTMSEPAAT